MNNLAIKLGTEEVALALTLIGEPQIAQETLVAQFGDDLTQEEVQTRLLTAGHSLMARDYLTVDSEGKIHLDAEVSEVADILAHADYSVRFERAYSNADLMLTFHFKDGRIFGHALEQGLVHNITRLESIEPILTAGVEFFQIRGDHPFPVPPFSLQESVIDSLTGASNEDEIVKLLKTFDTDPDIAKLLAEDLAAPDYRGGVLKVLYDSDRRAFSDEGFLILAGAYRKWLLQPMEGETSTEFEVSLCSSEIFTYALRNLIQPEPLSPTIDSSK